MALVDGGWVFVSIRKIAAQAGLFIVFMAGHGYNAPSTSAYYLLN